ncbi:MAG TPA: VWA domain-containing protein [Vicinamibacterales bacterium]|nr:VWA domain-containing protein [Vicinamibacterales bacterium]
MHRAAAVAGIVAVSAIHATARQATFSSKVEVVRVDVLVTDGGKPVSGLQPGDFEIRDDGVLQTVDLVASEKIPLNVILALDSSGSVSGERLDDLQKASRALLERLNPRDKAALLTFSHAISLRMKLTSDIGRVRDALNGAAPSGGTALVDATYAAMQLEAADGGRNLLIVFSDGLDTASWLDPERVIASARRSEVVVYSATSREAEDSRFLEDLTETTGGGLVKIASTKDLSAAFLRILDEFRNRYLVSYSPAGVSTSGWHRLQVRLKGRRGTVKARAGYQAGS